MDNYSKIYWLTRLDYVQNIFIAIAIILGILIVANIFNAFIKMIGDCDEIYFLNSIWKKAVTIFFFSLSIIAACLTPTKTEMILIYAGGKTMDYVQKDTSLQKIPYQTTTIISDYLDKSIKELKEKK